MQRPFHPTPARAKKWPPSSPSVPSGYYSTFRLLCRIPIIADVIGKSGHYLNILRQETGANLRVETAVPSCDERVIVVVGPSGPKRTVRLSLDEEAEVEVEVTAPQEALLRVFTRILEVEAETQSPADEESKATVRCRLLVPKNLVGFLMGKGGKRIQSVRRESGAMVSVLPADQLPACAAPEDVLMQIMGDTLAVKRALVAISWCLTDNPLADKSHIVSGAPRTISQQALPGTHMDFLPHKSSLLSYIQGSSADYASSDHFVPTVVDRTSILDQRKAQQQVSFRMLCSNEKIGGVIGNGGSLVKALENETGATIRTAPSVVESEERIITVSASESPESQFSQAQNAVIRVFHRITELGMRKGVSGFDKGAPVTARLLVPTNQVGCLMGKGGAIIQEMKKISGANIWVIGRGQIPKCALENDEVVQITGQLGNVQDALMLVTGRLRDSLFPANMLNGHTGMTVYRSLFPESQPYGRVGPTSANLYSSLGLSCGLGSQGTLVHSMDQLGLSNSTQLSASPRLRTSQVVGSGNPRVIQDTGNGLTTSIGDNERGSGSKSAIVTKTTVDILVPGSVFGFVYGENGSNLDKIRQISGASVVVHDPNPSIGDGRVVISGTPDQTQAAQSLLQAFILSGQPAVGPYG